MFFHKLALALFGPRHKNTRQLVRAQQRQQEKNRTHNFKRSPVTFHLASRMHAK